ncbi:MAG: glycosyltransferase family 4 protein [Actinomycetota bacterium]|nr:glycosyltransferase family 4 protein [Actinomycetota bacterium]
MRVLIISLSTYSGPYNDGKLTQLGLRLGGLTAVAGDIETLWGSDNHGRSGSGYEVRVLPLRFARAFATTQLVGLEKVAEAVRPTIIHIECEPWQGVAVQSVRLAQRHGVPVGVHLAETGPLLTGVGGAIRRARGSWVLRRCDYAVGWSTASTRVAEQLAPGIRTDTFPATGVSLSGDDSGSPDQWFGTGSAALPKLAFVGRFLKEKGIYDFLQICDELARRLPLRAALAGGQGIDQTVRRWAEERPWAFFHGILPRTHVGALVAAADVLVCPSRTTSFVEEQFGKAAVEAMAVGTAVFAYDCGALSEVIGAGGVVVPEGAQDQLVDKLEEYFAGPASDEVALAQQARRQAERFSNEALAKKLINLWSLYNGPAS